jgi:DGQHR domain-containing protein
MPRRPATRLTGRPLEIEGKQVITALGLACMDALRHTPLVELDPAGAHAVGEHLEFDYLVPLDERCLVGEITSRSDPSDMRDKFGRFRHHLDIFRIAFARDMDTALTAMGVSVEDQARFRHVRQISGFVVMTELQHFDARLPTVPGVVSFDELQWKLISEYAGAIGSYARPAFLDGFGIPPALPGDQMLLGARTLFPLIYAADRKIATGLSDRADLFTFEASPFALLRRAQVYRRDLLPDIAERSQRKFQRALMIDKLTKLRRLITADDFCFPTAILIVLSSDSQFADGRLTIPDRYGAVSVIDGQHRLFSYADADVRARVADNGRIMVTAIQFRSPDQREHARNSARIFVEINSNQTQIRPSHIDAISYDILGLTTPRALAAQAILRLNDRPNGRTFGLFDTSQTHLGVIAAPTVMNALKPLVALTTVRDLLNANTPARVKRKRGYESLFSLQNIAEITAPEALLEKAVVALERYFNLIARWFRHDWPKRGGPNQSSLRHAKVMGAFVKLFQHFIARGDDWAAVERQVAQLHANLMTIRHMRRYSTRLFNERYPNIVPTATPSMNADLRFLLKNLIRPTKMTAALASRGRAQSRRNR